MGVNERREREKAQRRETILDAAEALLFERGYEATKMIDIAERCELSKGTLYLYFRSKEELARAIVGRSYEALLAEIEAAIVAPASGREQLEAMLATFRRYYQRQADRLRLIFTLESSLLSSGAGIEEWPEYLKYAQRATGFMTAALERGVQDGSVRGNLDPAVASATYIIVTLAFLQRMFAYGGIAEALGHDAHTLTEGLFTLLLNSLQ